YRLKTSRFGRELRITDLFSRGSIRKMLRSHLAETIKRHQVDYVTISAFAGGKDQPELYFPKVSLTGPVVTVRPISTKAILDDFISFKAWSPSLGDLELF